MIGNGIERCFAACNDCHGHIVSHLTIEACRATRQHDYYVSTPAKIRYICDGRAIEEMYLRLLTGTPHANGSTATTTATATEPFPYEMTRRLAACSMFWRSANNVFDMSSGGNKEMDVTAGGLHWLSLRGRH
jgi:hypothetical protein